MVTNLHRIGMRPARWLLWTGAFAVLIALRLPRLDAPFLGPHDFRQTQTALTAYWFHEGVTLPDYPLPVLGYPWTAPMEFPTFQLAVAGLNAFAVPPDLAGRICGLATFAGAVAAMLLLVRTLGGSERVQFAFLGLAALSPFGLVFGRACLIEFTAVLLGLVYLWLSLKLRFASNPGVWMLVAILTGSLAAVTKVTTFPVFWIPATLLAAVAVWPQWQRRSISGLRPFFLNTAIWLLVLFIPLITAASWTEVSDQVKARSPMTAWLTSDALKWWNFGPMAQRFSAEGWQAIGRRIGDLILPLSWPFALIGLFAVWRASMSGRLFLMGLALGGAAVVLIFFNLYAVHDYYLCAIVFPLWLLTAFGMDRVANLFRSRLWRIAVVIAPLGAVAATSLYSDFVRIAYRDRSTGEIMVLAQAVQARTAPAEEIVVFGDSWNPRILYYCRRKGLMAVEPVATDPFVAEYVTARHVHHVIAHQKTFSRVRNLWPEAHIVTRTQTLALFSLDVSPPVTSASPRPNDLAEARL